jgi:putative flippase GtrA
MHPLPHASALAKRPGMQALLLRLARRLPAPARALVTSQRIRLLTEFIKFGMVGCCGFVVDTAVVYGLRGPLGLYGAGLVSYVIAATVTWILNRSWTFRGRGSGPAHHQWGRFLGVNTLGFTLNRGTYALLVTFVPLCAAQPVFATFAGAVAGMFVNFNMSRALVFR